jgi:hypothetical protein
VSGELIVQVWPMEESSDFGYTQALFNLSYIYFCPNNESRSRFVQHIQEAERNLELSSATRENVRKMELLVTSVRGNLIAHLYTLVTKHNLRLHISKPDVCLSSFLLSFLIMQPQQQYLSIVKNAKY